MAKTRRARKGAGIGSILAKGVGMAAQGVGKVVKSVGRVVPEKYTPGYGPEPREADPFEHIYKLPPDEQIKYLQGLANVYSTLRDGEARGGRSSSSGGEIVTHLLTIRNQVKLYHWQTKQFARHKATDDLTAALDTSIDAFVESYMGRYGRPSVSGSIKLHNFSENAAKAFVAKETKYLETELPKKIGKNDTDLLNMRDTILGDLTKVSYLFTLA